SLGKNGHRGVVGHFAVLNDAAVTMVRVFAETNIRNHKEFQFCCPNRFNGALYHAMSAEGTRAARIFRFRQSKENNAGNPQPLHLPAFFHDLISGLLMNARHGADFLPHLRPRTYKHRIDEPGRREACLTRQATQGFGPSQSPRTMGGETHRCFAPAGACFTIPAKCSSSASMTDAAVVSLATTMRRTPASRRALAVTGPTAVIASLSCSTRNCSTPNTSPKCCTVDGLKNRIASASAFA